MGQTCGIRPACAPYSIIQHTNRACLHVIVVPFADYYNTYSAYVGPEYPPWQMVLSRVAFRAKNGERLSKQATLTIEVTNKVDAVEFSVNRTMYEAYYLERAVLGTFRLYASDFDALLVHLTVTTLVDELSNALQVRVTKHDVRFHLAELVERRLVRLHEDTVVDLAQTQELKNLLRLRVDVVKTAEAHHEDELILGFDIETTLGARFALEAHEIRFL